MIAKIRRNILYVGAVVIFLLFMVSKLVYNKMIDEEHFMHISHGKLEAALHKREDLNRNALKAVNVYVEMEGELMHRLMTLAKEVKSGANAARIAAMRNDIERLISSMDVLVMMSPHLKSKGPYIHLMETFKSTENEVLAARLQYNTAVCEYNMFLDKFPYRLVTLVYGFKKAALFEKSEGIEVAPDVSSGT
ncbi:MAG: LemA family protein [Nitrospirae bacterium]|uniref:Magnetosome protein MamQ-II n=1 Tax=uncultured Nitrospirota bacterium TaxID=170969 RepID=A0A142BTV2_9BACT|nr:magnetosome protein MamQ-II [uncultured Nitrospirota bacterium]MBF0328606.1 LemA family protein [Nitrospirota bacterium]